MPDEQLTIYDAHARRSDPNSSHIAVQNIGRDTSLRDHIYTAANQLEDAGYRWWTDTLLTELIELNTGRRQQRNVIARARGLMERHGYIERLGLDPTSSRPLMRFRLTDHSS